LAPSASVWRAGRESGSGNILAHSPFSAARPVAGSFIQKFTLMMSSTLPPAASTQSLICLKTLLTWPPRSGGMALVCGSRPLMMLDIRMLPIRLALGMGFSCLKPG
jgi:hypothetical protein